MFATLTFNPRNERAKGGVHPEKADKAFRLLISEAINRPLWGPNWASKQRKNPDIGVVWARGTELHKSGHVHFHALLSAPHVDLNSVIRRLDLMDYWYGKFGIARIERPESQLDVVEYTSKYVTKDGQVDLSTTFGTARPPSLFDTRDELQKLREQKAAEDRVAIATVTRMGRDAQRLGERSE